MPTRGVSPLPAFGLDDPYSRPSSISGSPPLPARLVLMTWAIIKTRPTGHATGRRREQHKSVL
jgi:hypothetical protein